VTDSFATVPRADGNPSSVRQPSRRDFLRVALLAGGEIAFGVSIAACGGGFDAATAARADKTGEFSPNAWIKIFPDNRVVFVLDSVEMGQGTMTSHTTLVAEELEVDPRKIHVELAPASRSYINTDPQIGFQITGGSTSVKVSWDKLRKAGAAAREMLRAGAADGWGVPIEECRAEDGIVKHERSGRAATYGSLTRAAARQPVPEPRLKHPRDFKWIGKSVERLDSRPKVDGSCVYGIDVRLPGLLTAVVVRSPVIGGKLEGFEASAAMREPGVIDVFEIPTGVAVVATSYWRARKAAELVKARWNEGRLAAMSSTALRAEYRRLSEQPAKVVRDDGSFPKASSGGRVIDATYEVPYLAHATMEPQNATAHVTDTRCEVWAPTQSPGLALEEARRITGLAPDAIAIHQTLLGGGFGRRLEQDYVAEAVYVSRRVKKPVKVVFSREDDLRTDFYRPMTYNVLRGALDAGGAVTGWFHRIVAQSIVAYAAKQWVPAIAGPMPQAIKPLLARGAAHLYKSAVMPDDTAIEGASDFAYGIPNLLVEHRTVDPGVPVGFWRGVGHSENAFIVESFLDELAHAGRRDPYALRRALLANAPRHLAVLDLAASKAGWNRPAPPGVFRGIAQCKAFGSYCAEVVEVEKQGGALRIRRVVGAIDCGIVVNPDIVRAQIESAVVFGLSAALKQAITFSAGRVEQSNFHDYQLLRMNETPPVEVHIVPSNEPPSGVGEPGLPPAAPALANALFAATGKRFRSMPFSLG
jgi:isoquinoline 1-oxidoreductase subunit beta